MTHPPAPSRHADRRPALAIRRSAVLLVVLIAATVGVINAASAAVSAAPAPAPAAVGAIAPTVACSALGTADFSAVETSVQSATVETIGDHEYCSVKGFISPQTGFQVILPTTTWRGDYLQQGCAGLCGFVNLSVTDPGRATGQAPYAPLTNGELVVAASDQGHASSGALWAERDPALRVVFGYSSEHSLAETSKALMGAYYGRGATHRYFDGFSDGGREAVDLAQRYPDDFDGIIAGAPASNWSALLGLFEPWMGATNQDSSGRPILTAEQLPALHAAVMKQCANADGVLLDPRACTFDPATLQCPTESTSDTCLTPAQVRVVRAFYQGPTDRHGRNLFNGGLPYGSELAWQGWSVLSRTDTTPADKTFAADLALNYHRYMAYWKNPPNDFGLRDVAFTTETHRELQTVGDIYDATNPDLSRFAARGGKIILYHGWADQAIPPFATLDYYQAVVRVAGSYTKAQEFSRLYMVPGAYHCPCGVASDGDPQTTVDVLTPLARWVSDNVGPGTLTFPVTAQTTGTGLSSLSVAPYDTQVSAPRNNGLNSNYAYVGRVSTYRPGALWCEQDGPNLECRRR